MLPSVKRLSVKQVDQVLKKGRVFHNPLFWLRFVKNDGITKVVVICPKKIAKSAVLRNSIRRNIYNVIEGFLNSLDMGYDIVVCVKDSLVKFDQKQINEKTKEIFVKAGVLK